MVKRHSIPRRRRFFIGCEGESERGYAALLQMFAENIGLAIHIDANVVPRAGDPLALAERASAMIIQGERGSKPAYVDKFLQFDTDCIGDKPERDEKMLRVACDASLTLIRQNICFESFLLRHFIGHENDSPATSANALSKLKIVFPNYKKGMSGQDLSKQVCFEDTQRVSANHLNSDFSVLLGSLGFPR